MSAEVVKLSPDHYLMREGEESNEMYYLASGTLAVFKRKGDTEKQIGTIYKGELVGEMSFLDNEPRSASVKAIGECELHVIPKAKLEDYLKAQPKWHSTLVRTLIERLRTANNRVRV